MEMMYETLSEPASQYSVEPRPSMVKSSSSSNERISVCRKISKLLTKLKYRSRGRRQTSRGQSRVVVIADSDRLHQCPESEYLQCLIEPQETIPPCGRPARGQDFNRHATQHSTVPISTLHDRTMERSRHHRAPVNMVPFPRPVATTAQSVERGDLKDLRRYRVLRTHGERASQSPRPTDPRTGQEVKELLSTYRELRSQLASQRSPEAGPVQAPGLLQEPELYPNPEGKLQTSTMPGSWIDEADQVEEPAVEGMGCGENETKLVSEAEALLQSTKRFMETVSDFLENVCRPTEVESLGRRG